MGCPEFMFSVVPWFVALIVLSAVETLLLIGVTVRQLSIRSTVLDAIEARLLVLDQDEGRYIPITGPIGNMNVKPPAAD